MQIMTLLEKKRHVFPFGKVTNNICCTFLWDNESMLDRFTIVHSTNIAETTLLWVIIPLLFILTKLEEKHPVLSSLWMRKIDYWFPVSFVRFWLIVWLSLIILLLYILFSFFSNEEWMLLRKEERKLIQFYRFLMLFEWRKKSVYF